MIKPKKKIRFDSKLHCNPCGGQRIMKLTIPFTKEDETDKTTLVQVNLQTLKNMLRDGTLPKQKGFEFAKSPLFGICTVCSGFTYYQIKNNKLVAIA
jgi:hypothetical protein